MHVKLGLEVLLETRIELLRDRRIGILVHPASINSRLEHTLDLFFEHPEINLTTVMGPQHGARGETQDNMIEWHDYRDSVTSLPVFSLYSQTRKPTETMLAKIDTLVVDLQDIGSRYYTFIHTLVLTMQACQSLDKSLIVLDRPNPINGKDIEGPVLDPHFQSFVGLYPLAVRHGMTIGELALYFNQEFKIACKLEVVKMQQWDRELFFEESNLPWVLPSPNIPTIDTAITYPGMCLLEGTNVSEGRGTTRPFELSGAPWIKAKELVSRVSKIGLPGVYFRPVYFTPTFQKWAGELVEGCQIHVVDRSTFRPFRTGLALLQLYREIGEDQFQWKQPPYEYEHEKLPIDILCGTDRVRKQLEIGASVDDLEQLWDSDLERFAEVRQQYLLY